MSRRPETITVRSDDELKAAVAAGVAGRIIVWDHGPAPAAPRASGPSHGATAPAVSEQAMATAMAALAGGYRPGNAAAVPSRPRAAAAASRSDDGADVVALARAAGLAGFAVAGPDEAAGRPAAAAAAAAHPTDDADDVVALARAAGLASY